LPIHRKWSSPHKGKNHERIAQLEIRFAHLTLMPPQRLSHLAPVKLWAIYVHEPSPPQGLEPLSWMLLTTVEIASLHDALLFVQYYTVRFSIELFHKVLKSGCALEKRQLETADGLKRCLALDSIVSWRILFLTMMGRTIHLLPCTIIFEEHEWKSLYCFVHKTKQPPSQPPTIEEAIRLVARLGGFLSRKRDGSPGIKVLWQGLQALTAISAAWIAFGPESS